MSQKGFLSLLTLVFFFSCLPVQKENEEKEAIRFPGFIYLEDEVFKLDSAIFFPKLMNYIIQPRHLNGKLIFSPSLEYDDPNTFDSDSEEESNERLRAHFKAIRNMGFNSLRLVGINYIKLNEKNSKVSMKIFKGLRREALNLNNSSITSIIEALEKVVNIADEEGLKIMLLLPKPAKDKDYTQQKDKYVSRVLQKFSKTKSIFSYDFFNEPLYFDNSELSNSKEILRDKLSALEIVRKWKQQIRKHAPHQLFTISFVEPIEVLEWDPSILPVDFVSIHTYHPLRVPNEIYWYAKYINKPWIISETSLPADNDSISYEEQSIFMREAFQRVINCGGIGFGWWQYQDVSWGPFEHNFTPLISSGGKTFLDSNTFILGEFKDAAFVLPELKVEKTGECNCHMNYYNMMGYKNYKISGNVVDEDNNPIEGAVIRAWNEYWTVGMHTFSNEKGEFNLYSNDENIRFEISAPGYTKLKYTKRLKFQPHPKSLTLDWVKLEYHRNNYQWYMDSTYIGESVFQFNEELFDDFKTTSSLGTIQLEKLKL